MFSKYKGIPAKLCVLDRINLTEEETKIKQIFTEENIPFVLVETTPDEKYRGPTMVLYNGWIIHEGWEPYKDEGVLGAVCMAIEFVRHVEQEQAYVA